jgi:exonuclease SbcD
MKLLQLSDLHLGKRLKEFSLLEDQRYVLNQALALAKDERVDALLLSGDIYDSSLPNNETTALFDEFLSAVHEAHLPTFIISGNHDSADKLHFGSAIFSDEGIHIVTRVADSLKPFPFEGVNLYLLPFIRPLDVNEAFGASDKTYSEALQDVIARMGIDTTKTNLLLAHQMVVPPSGKLPLGGSEDILSEDGVAVGDVSAVPAELFQAFDYVALGHIHKPQTIAKNMRYSGSILKYHRDEANSEKSFTLIEVEGKKITLSTHPIHFLHDVIHLTGTLEEILHAEADKNAYLFASLTDPALLEDPMSRLRSVYPYAAWVDYVSHEVTTPEVPVVDVEHVSKEELFQDFFQQQNGTALTKEQAELVHETLQKEEKR